MTKDEVSKISVAVNRWLAYQLLCGRDSLLSEAYLGQPIAEYCIHKHGGAFQTEINHPTLKNVGPGRPRQIDYVLLTPHSRKIQTALECKWITETLYDKQRILNDALRLECVRVAGQATYRYLIVAGLKDHFDKNFKNLKFKDKSSFTRDLFSFSMLAPQKKIKVATCGARFAKLYKNFCVSYKSEIPKGFCTELVGYRTADNISVAVWKITSNKNRTSFKPAKAWVGS